MQGKMTLKLAPSEIEGQDSEMLMDVMRRNFSRKLLEVLKLNPVWYEVTIADHSTIGQDYDGNWESGLIYTITRRRSDKKIKTFRNNYA